MAQAYDTRMIQSGDIVEIIRYEKLILIHDTEEREKGLGSSLGRSVEASEEDKQRHREYTLYKARNDVRRLINSNVYQWQDEYGKTFRPVFLTLTFADNVTDLDDAHSEFRRFIKRLGNYVTGFEGSLKYVVVPEFQKRGAVHYHLVLFNLPYTPAKELQRIWGQGFIKINAIDEVDNVGAYICKYMTKEEDGDQKERLRGRKCYFSSRGLHKPKEVKARSGTEKEKEIEEAATSLSQFKRFSTHHESDYLGLIEYTQYNMNAKHHK